MKSAFLVGWFILQFCYWQLSETTTVEQTSHVVTKRKQKTHGKQQLVKNECIDFKIMNI